MFKYFGILTMLHCSYEHTLEAKIEAMGMWCLRVTGNENAVLGKVLKFHYSSRVEY